MVLDELVLALQHLVDRVVRRVRLGPAPLPGVRRLLVVQIDGLPRSVLEQALADGRMPFLARLMRRGGHRMHPMNVGLPSSTPAFQMAAMYGVRPDIPGFHYHDKRRRSDVYFPRGGDAAEIERRQAAGQRGILDGGSAYGCVFTGGAVDNLFTFAVMKRPTGAGLAGAVAAFVVLGWVTVKSLVLTLFDVAQAVLRLIADPVGEVRRGWKWLAIKLGISVWVRQLFTLAVSRDLYRGVPAVYVNYLDYDVFAHAYGPRHRRALRALRRIDRSMEQLWRTMRRVPEHRYELYVLSDHGQMACTPYVELQGGKPLERVLVEEFFAPGGAEEIRPGHARGRRLLRGIKAVRSRRAPGLFQRFVNYLQRDFPSLLGELPESREGHGVRVVAAGPNAFVYFLESEEALALEWVDQRWPGLADDISRARGVGLVLARADAGPVCIVQGKRMRLSRDEPGPFGGRPEVVDGIRDLMAMPSAGDLVIYGNDTPEGNVSYVAEHGAHAGISEDEMETFVVAPTGSGLPERIGHPVELYPHFVASGRPDVHLVVASYNIHRGIGLDRRRDLDRIAEVIGEIAPDVVGLQEVICETGAPHADQPAYLAKRLGMDLVMGATRPHGDGSYGNAVLTRLPIRGNATCDLSRGLREPRGCLRVDLGAKDDTLHVFNCHFGLAMRERREQLRLLGTFIRDSACLAGPRVLMGDFNEWHRGPVTRGLRLEFSSPMRRMRRTHPAVFPLFRLDRIYWDVDLEGEAFHAHRSRLSRVASDHLPVVARLRVRGGHSQPPRHPYVIGDALPPPE